MQAIGLIQREAGAHSPLGQRHFVRPRLKSAPANVQVPCSQDGGRCFPFFRRSSAYEEWLDTPKDLSGRALAESSGLVRVRNPDGTVCTWRERGEIDALLEAGWLLA